MSHLFKTTSSCPNALMLLIAEDEPSVPDIDGIANLWQSESMLALVGYPIDLRTRQGQGRFLAR
ncbi:hypothetical protein J2805_001756 [Arthrobacter oryzae]|nr:hypothetical protein [Arthrobacter oryzae]